MPFDFKKEYKEFYLPPQKPEIIDIPAMSFIAVRGKGNPNDEGGEYKKAIEKLYAIAYTIKMSYKGSHKIAGFFEYVVPPLEGFWWQEGIAGFDYQHKEKFSWISVIRLPEFVTKEDFAWAVSEAEKKKKIDLFQAEYFVYHEGLCVQCMHLGTYDEEPATVMAMNDHALKNGYKIDIGDGRFHHELYLTDPRKGEPSKQKTVIRHPIKRI